VVSIIIPALNEADLIGNTLKAVSETEGEKEVIVVDGGSKDGTVSIAKKFARVVKSSPGRGVQMNTGASEAKGDAFLFLYADTVVPKTAVRLIEEALKDPHVVGGRFDLGFNNPAFKYRLAEVFINHRGHITQAWGGDHGTFVRRELFEKLGGFKEISLMDDIDFVHRLKRCGKVVVLQGIALTSPRKYEEQSLLKTGFKIIACRYLYKLGVSSEKLVKLYNIKR